VYDTANKTYSSNKENKILTTGSMVQLFTYQLHHLVITVNHPNAEAIDTYFKTGEERQ